jgi:hypothetical protein
VDKKISLAEFVEKAKSDLAEFEAHWQENDYPNALPPGDWDEQFIFFFANKMGIDVTSLFNIIY